MLVICICINYYPLNNKFGASMKHHVFEKMSNLGIVKIVFSLFVTEQAREDLVVFRSVRLIRLNRLIRPMRNNNT